MTEDDSSRAGRPRQYDSSDAAEIVIDHAPEPLTAGEVADVLDCGDRTALRRLREAAGVDDGEAIDGVNAKEVGSRAMVFWYDRDAVDGE